MVLVVAPYVSTPPTVPQVWAASTGLMSDHYQQNLWDQSIPNHQKNNVVEPCWSQGKVTIAEGPSRQGGCGTALLAYT